VAHGLCHCRTLHRNEGHRLRRRLPRGLHPPQEEHDLRGRSPTFENVPQLYIDPVECIDCGACVPVCPVSAIFALDDLPEKWKQHTELNESYVKAGKFTPEEFAKHQSK
jgi:NAD-dependent dihydropyrimidine dehydrogenase PreA subunit